MRGRRRHGRDGVKFEKGCIIVASSDFVLEE